MSNILNNVLFEAFANASENVYIYVCDMKTNQLRWSQNAIDYFHMPGEYMDDAGMIWVDKIHPEDRDIYLEDIEAVFSGQSQTHHCQYRAMNKYGDYVWLECRGSVINDPNGEPRYFAGMMTRLSANNKYDPLTNLYTIHELYNRDLPTSGTMILLGFDYFRKFINNYGYGFGNQILKEFSKNLLHILSSDETVFRFGNDEFLIVCSQYDSQQTKQLYQKIKDMLIQVGKNLQPITTLEISAGAVRFPADGQTKDELISNLEHSLEHAKEKRRGELVFFSQEIALEHQRHLSIKEALTQSIKNYFVGFELYYQPIIYQFDKTIIGCEALLRWHTDTIHDCSPIEFIKYLEESKEIKEVGKWVAEQVFQQAHIWHKEYPELMINFNVSYIQFEDNDFVDFLIQKAKYYHISPSKIVIELTESCHVSNVGQLSVYFKQLQDAGFQIALDDFGTAYSSLSLLKNLPANYIKVDHSLVKELSLSHNHKDFIIVDNLVHLSHCLSFECIIEGVENKEMEDILMDITAPYFQGYYYSRPVPKQEFEKLLKQRRKTYGTIKS